MSSRYPRLPCPTVSRVSPVARAALLVALEGLALLLLGLVYGGAGVVGDPFDRTATLLEAGMAVLAGVLVLLVARGLGEVRGWARSPAVVVQLLALPVGYGLVQGRVWDCPQAFNRVLTKFLIRDRGEDARRSARNDTPLC